MNITSIGTSYNPARTQNFLGGPKKGTSDPYPVGGGNVDKNRYETQHGWNSPSSSARDCSENGKDEKLHIFKPTPLPVDFGYLDDDDCDF